MCGVFIFWLFSGWTRCVCATRGQQIKAKPMKITLWHSYETLSGHFTRHTVLWLYMIPFIVYYITLKIFWWYMFFFHHILICCNISSVLIKFLMTNYTDCDVFMAYYTHFITALYDQTVLPYEAVNFSLHFMPRSSMTINLQTAFFTEQLFHIQSVISSFDNTVKLFLTLFLLLSFYTYFNIENWSLMTFFLHPTLTVQHTMTFYDIQ